MTESYTHTAPRSARIGVVFSLLILALCACFILGGCQNNASNQKSSQSTSATSATPSDPAASFPSWNSDSAALKELTEYVKDVTNESSPHYIPPEDRIVTFDMDGTILCEKAPYYFDHCLAMHRILDDPTYTATPEERETATRIRESARDIESYNGQDFSFVLNFLSRSFAGMEPKAYRDYINDYAEKTPAYGFEGMTYAQSFFKPMIEVIQYLRDNDFDVWMVSASSREIVRALTSRIGIPFDHVVATDVPYLVSGLGDQNLMSYDIAQGEKVILGATSIISSCYKSGKIAAIAREIGKQPVMTFGNSSGDYSMFNYVKSNPDYVGKAFAILCDDSNRTYSNQREVESNKEHAAKEGWNTISMEKDWKTIFGDNVKRTLPQSQTSSASSAQTMQNAA